MSVAPHMKQLLQNSGGRDGKSDKISLGNRGDEDDSKCSNPNFFLWLFAGILVVALLSTRNIDKIYLSCIQLV